MKARNYLAQAIKQAPDRGLACEPQAGWIATRQPEMGPERYAREERC